MAHIKKFFILIVATFCFLFTFVTTVDTYEDPITATSADVDTGGQKYAYLTFDDGPSTLTPQILDVLKAKGVNATFFVTGQDGDQYADILRRTVDEGNLIALHTYSHDYRYIYTSADNYFEDLYALQNMLRTTIGYETKIFRFPGGSSNTVSHKYGGAKVMNEIIERAKAEKFVYYDWNVSSEDAVQHLSAGAIANRVIKGAKKHNCAVMLFHDLRGNKTTLEAIPIIVDALQKEGYIFQTVDQMPEPLVHKR